MPSEHAFQRAVITYAHLTGWHVAHFRPMKDKHGRWKTPMQGDVGFPDLVLARKGYVVFVELKSERGRLTVGQRGWFEALRGSGFRATGAHDVQLWRPSDWNTLVEILK